MKRISSIVAVLACALALAVPGAAFADHLSGGAGWTVAYTDGGALSDNFSSQEYADAIGDLLPGDDITLEVKLRHENAQAADWYLANEVLKSLEDGTARGSAYGYLLTYTGPGGATRTLYDSKAVGGEGGGGLADATKALDEFVFLETLSKGQTASVKLTVSLDGETEGNDYFDTLARLQMKFAVEPQTTATTTTRTSTTTGSALSRNAVKTGDGTELFPFFVGMAASGAGLLGLAVWNLRRGRAKKEGTR